jgi:hypothetical protein
MNPTLPVREAEIERIGKALRDTGIAETARCGATPPPYTRRRCSTTPAFAPSSTEDGAALGALPIRALATFLRHAGLRATPRPR